ncbi:MAG TPA: flavodoxin domain-containing protein [Longimicrobium sp.]|nr:flavodoxin domain-containing protein [Longimicrobium sp.]
MASVLVVYGTTEGQTRKIAHFVGHVARQLGHAATVLDASLDPAPEGHDAVIVAASVHQLRHQSAVMHFAAEHRHLLNTLPTAFFSVSLAAALDDPHHQVEAREVADELLAETRWQPQMVRLVAGALLYSKYDWMKRMLMQMIARHDGRDTDTSRDWEYTDWERLRGDVEQFLALVPAASPSDVAPPAEAAEPAIAELASTLAAAPG